MPALYPSITAKLARDVYALTKLDTLEQAYSVLNRNYAGVFDFGGPSLLKGRTGGPGPIKCQTAFGFNMIGKAELNGHLFMLFRGTQYLADWLTNLNASVSRSACGELVHDGFNKTFLSLKPQLASFLDSVPKQNVKEVHCIGHSLGGAIATICAQWVANKGYRPYLYTYGSPRVGLQRFAEKCTANLDAKKIFRAYHRTDVVPMIPTWPFYHTPFDALDYYLYSPGALPGAKYHGMDEYVASISRIGDSWKQLGAHKEEKHTDSMIAKWLADNSHLPFSLMTMKMLADAIVWVLNKCASAGMSAIKTTFVNTFTLMDKIAYILGKSVEMFEDLSIWVVRLIQKMVYMLGQAHKIERSTLSRDYIREVLLSMQHKLHNLARNALSQALVQGRAI